MTDTTPMQQFKKGLKAIQRVLLTEISGRKMWWQLQILCLKLLMRAVNSAWFKIFLGALLRPVLRVGVYWFIAAVFLDRLPKGWEKNPQIAESMTNLRATWNAQATRMNDKSRAVDQKLTWRIAGGGVVILTAIVTTHNYSPATLVAAICLALSVPLLIVLGAISAFQTDETTFPLTMRDMLMRTFALWATQFVFYTGFAAILWSYDAKVAIALLAGSYLAWRYFRRIALKYHSPKQSKADQDPPSVVPPPLTYDAPSNERSP